MGRKKNVNIDNVKQALIKYKSDIVKGKGKLPFKSDKIWNAISQEVQGDLTPLAIHTIVRKNRYNVWSILEYENDSEDFGNILDSEMKSDKDVDSRISSDGCKNMEFEIEISPNEYASMFLHEKMYKCSELGRKNKFRNYMTFKRGWTHTTNDVISKHTALACILIFKRVKIHPAGQNFVTIYASCKICNSLRKGTVIHEPVENQNVKSCFEYSRDFKQSHPSNVKCPLSSSVREKGISEMLEGNMAPSIYRQLKDHKMAELGADETCNIPSCNVLRVAKLKKLRATRVHKNQIAASGNFKTYISMPRHYKGYRIRSIFCALLEFITESFYNKYCKKSMPSTISIDAAGSMCQKIKREKKSKIKSYIFK